MNNAAETLYRVHLSECGKYYAVRFRKESTPSEAWSRDGKIHWVDGPRSTSWTDRHFAVPYMVGGWSSEMPGQKAGSFTLRLLCCDARKIIEPFTGNTIIDQFDCVFRRKVPAQNVPKFLRGAYEQR